jgi:hypothetical protein
MQSVPVAEPGFKFREANFIIDTHKRARAHTHMKKPFM